MARWNLDLPPASVAEMLRGWRVDELRELARRADIKPPTHKESIVIALCREVMSRHQRAAVAEAVHSPEGRVDWFQVEARYGVNAKELYTGLLPLLVDGRGWVPRDLVELPEPPPPQLATLPSLDPRRAQEEGLSIFLAERAAPRDLLTVLALTDAGQIRVGEKTRHISGASARELYRALTGGDYYPLEWTPDRYTPPIGPIRAFAWPLLIQQARLANAEGSRLYLTQPGKRALRELHGATLRTSASGGAEELAAALASAAAPFLKQIWEAWERAEFDEFSRLEAIGGQRSKGGRHMTEPSWRRAAIAEALAELPVGQWVALDELDRYLRAAGYRFEVSEEPGLLYIGEPHYGSLWGGGQDLWRVVERRYMMAFVMEYAATLGIVDVAYRYPNEAARDFDHLWGTDGLPYLSRYDGLAYVRLTPLGAFCLGAQEAYEFDASRVLRGDGEVTGKGSGGSPPQMISWPVLVVNDEGIVEPAGELLPADAVFLDRVARRIQTARGSKPGAASDGRPRWQLHRDRLLEAAELGVDLAEVRAFLESRTGRRLPEAVEFLLDEAAYGARRLREVGRGIILEASDASLAQRLASDAVLGRYVVAVTGRHLVVREAGAKAAYQRLRKLGFGVTPGR